MKTAEVAVEHVLTGLLALCAFLLPLLSGLEGSEQLLKSEALIEPRPEQFLARLVILLCVVLATALPLLVWYRITETHMNFIYRKLPELLDKKSAGLKVSECLKENTES